MASWTSIEGRLSDGLPMTAYIAEHEGKLWCSAIGDDEHPRNASEFLTGLDAKLDWQQSDKRESSDALSQAATEVAEYFAGARREFGVPLAMMGTPFQVRVWQELLSIPFGVTCSYRDLANNIARPTACRAVGAANGRNRLPLLIPCHRVIAAAGGLCGFTGGIGLKKRLLLHEAAIAGSFALRKTA